MKKTAPLFLLSIVFFMVLSIKMHAASTRETILQLLKDYSPSGHYLVTRVQDLPEKKELYLGAKKIEVPILKEDLMTWVHGDTEKDILTSIADVVHEMCHYYTDNMAYRLLTERKVKVSFEDYYEAYYTGGKNDILVKRTKVFNTREIAAAIPESLRTFRFSYVNADKPRASQLLGIYGLLDEFNAYYYGTKTAVDMYPHYRDKMEPGLDRWVLFFDEVDSVSFAYPEFKFFILKYLLYARTNHPQVYQEMIKNRELFQAFFTIDQNFAQLMAEYFKIKEEIYESLRQEGYTVTEKESHYQITRIKPPAYRSGSNYLNTYNLLQNELQKEEYQALLKEIK